MAKRVVTYEVMTRKKFNNLKEKIAGCLYLIKEDGAVVAMFYGSMPVNFLSYTTIIDESEIGIGVFKLSKSLLNGKDYLG